MQAGWPSYDPAKFVTSTITIVIQVNGKHRGEISAAPDAGEAELVKLALENPKITAHLAGKPIKRVINIKDRLLNLLV
jgi:leucyl-tRNA synthetase